MRLSFSHAISSLCIISNTVHGLELSHFRRNATNDASSATGSQIPPNPEQSKTDLHNISIYDKVPGLWFEICRDDEGNPPCTAYCHKNDTACQTLAGEVVSSCKDVWSTYNGDRAKTSNPAPGWSLYRTTYGQQPSLMSTTVDVYTSFSTASAAVVKQNVHTNETNLQVTITPVYALGKPSTSVLVSTATEWATENSWLTKPTPTCRYLALSTTNDCGQCSIYGGSVELYYWPPTTKTDTAAPPVVTKFTVLTDGITLFSPTAYISLSTVYASNSCTRIGQNHTGTLLAMNPTDVSTQVHWGGKVGQTGANYYGAVNYADLTGVPPVTDYENQPSCLMFGCSTIFPTYNPTLVVPLALRTLRPEWADCGAALEGLYDPPIALTEQAVEALPTLPSQKTAATFTTSSAPTYDRASQCSSPAVSTPAKTSGAESTTKGQAPVAASDLASLLEGSGNGAGQSATPTLSSSSKGHPESVEYHQQDTVDPLWAAHPSSVSHSLQASASDDAALSSEDSTAIGSYIASIISLVRLETAESIPGSATDTSETVVSASPRSSSTLTENANTQNENRPGSTSLSAPDVPELDPSLQPSSSLTIEPHQNGFVVNGMTLAPGSPITLSGEASAMTVKMDVTNGETLIELGTTRTASLGPPASSGSTTTNSSSGGQVSTTATTSSSISRDVSVTTDGRGPSTSTSEASGFRKLSAIWGIAAAFLLLLDL